MYVLVPRANLASSRCPALLNVLGEVRFVHLGGAVIDAESRDFTVKLSDRRAPSHAGAADHLRAAVGETHQRFRHN